MPLAKKPSFRTQFHRRALFLGLGFGLIVLNFFAFTISITPVSAEPQFTDPVKVHCRSVAPKKALDACDDTDNIKRARNVATYRCESDASSEKKVACVEKYAKTYFDKAATSKPTPDSESSFTAALDKVFASSNRNPDKAAPGFGSLPAGGSSNPQEGCDPQTDARCAACNGSNPPAGCVQCDKTACADNAVNCTRDSCDLVAKYLNPIIGVLTLSFGLIAAGSLILGSLNYVTSEGDSQKTAKAKDRIAKTIFAIVMYMFFYGFIQFLVPGGVFNP